MKRKALITAINKSEFEKKLGRVLYNEAHIMVENKPSRMIVEIRDLDAGEMFNAIELFKKEDLTDEKVNDAAIHWLIKDNSKIVEIYYEPISQPKLEKMEIMENEMKTEQEQIKAIKQIIDERVETTLGYVQGRHGNVIKTVDTVIIARDIAEAGYGDVSEYKAKIERLEQQNAIQCDAWQKLSDENERLVTENNSNLRYNSVLRKENKKLKEEIKQAKIDVLNFLKDGYEVDISTSNDCDMVVRVDDIDELIKEIRAQ